MEANMAARAEATRVDFGMAQYLNQFDKSPYSYPANGRKIVDGESTLKGSWRPAEKL